MVIEQQAATGSNGGSAAMRRAMIDSQLRVSGVNDPAILSAMDRVAREDFVPESRRAVAYADRAVPLGNGRVLSPALTHGQMLTEAQLSADDNVLLIGGGTGYLAAVVEPLVGKLTVVESDPALSGAAPVKAGEWVTGPLAKGAATNAPYSLILIDGAVEQLSPELAAQLAPNGRVLTGLLDNGVMRLASGCKSGDSVVLQPLAEADFAALGEFAAPRKWSF